MASEHDHPKAAYDDVNTRMLALVGGVGTLLVFVAVVAVQVIYFRYDRAEQLRKVVNVPFRNAIESLEAQRERISVAGPGAFAENGEKSIPIDEAMKMVVAEYRQRQESSEQNEDSSNGGATN